MPPVWIFISLGVGIVLSAVVFLTIRSWEHHEVDKRAEDIVREQVEKLQVTMLRSMEVLHSIAAWHQVDGKIDGERFRQFVQPTLARQPELQALSWNPLVPDSRRAEFEAAAVAAGFPDFQFREKDASGKFTPARRRDEYVPVYFIEPLGHNTAALGYDLDSDPNRRLSLEQARDTGKPMATAPIHLAQGPDNQTGFLVLLPIYSTPAPVTLAERRQTLAGFAVAVFRVNDLVGGVLGELKEKGIAAKLFDESRHGELLYGESDNNALTDKATALVHLEIAGRQWAMTFAPTSRFYAAQSHAQSWLVLFGGLAFSLLMTAYLYGGWRRTRQIAEANAALQEEITVRQRAEAAADSANQAKSDFLASMSHEIRTPLNAILGYTQLMRRDPQFPPEQRDAVSAISASGRHLLSLINEILDLAKIEAGRMELTPTDFDLTALANGLAATFRPLCVQKKIHFRLEMKTSDGPARVHGDEGKLRQVLINLVGNAVKFTNAGEVYLRFESLPDDRWHFEVIDTGLGVPDEEQQEIFKPFHQGSGAGHQGGTGLGLAIAQRQVELLGGKLELQSERGIGSRFFFNIPLMATTDGAEEMLPPVSRLAPGQSVRALVVDDHQQNRDVLAGMLAAVGCEVGFAADGLEAIERTREDKPGIIFLDLLLPGLSGVETARRILSDAGDAPVPKIIAHTASALARHRDEAMAAGCVDFIAKPFTCERLYECLERHLGVRFERAETLRDHEEQSVAPLERVALPDELCARLMVAAELHSTTALKSCLNELRQRGTDATRLAEEIRHLMRSYDMDGIQRLLARTATPEVSA